jgi:hypothetical protein
VTIEQRVERLKKLIGLLRRDAEDGIATLAFIDVGQTKSAISAFEAGKGHIPILIRAALLQRLVMTIARMHDAGRDTDSLPNIFKLLSNADVRNRVLVAPEFEAPMKFAETLWTSLRDDARIFRLRKFRTTYLAHSISEKWGFERLVFDDIVTASRDTFSIVEALGVATAVAPSVLKPVWALYKKRAEEYWGRLAKSRG